MTEPDPAAASTPAAPGAAPRDDPSEDTWHRLHPLSPLLRGGVQLAAVVTFLISQQFDSLFGANSTLPEGQNLEWAALGVVGFLAVTLAVSWLSWRVSRFRIGTDTLELRTGLLFRQHRQVRYSRVQAVDVNRPLLARLTGLAEVKVQAAGSHDSDARLAYLSVARAREVRDELMVLAGRGDEASGSVGAGAADTSTASDALEGSDGSLGADGIARVAGRAEAIVRVPNIRLVQAALYSGSTIVILIGLPVLVFGLLFGLPGVVPTVGPILLGVGGNHIRRHVGRFNFELVRGRDGIRVRRGLTDLRTSSVPVHRIQAIAVRQPAFWRFTDWWTVEVNIAGIGSTASDDNESVVLSVGTREEALWVVRVLRPGADLEAVVVGMVGGDEGQGYVVAPERAKWLSPLVRRRHGYAVTPDALLVRGGRVRRFVNIVPHARIQSLTLHQGPVERRLRLARLHLLSTPGSVDPWVREIDEGAATTLLNEQVVRSGHARTRVA